MDAGNSKDYFTNLLYLFLARAPTTHADWSLPKEPSRSAQTAAQRPEQGNSKRDLLCRTPYRCSIL